MIARPSRADISNPQSVLLLRHPILFRSPPYLSAMSQFTLFEVGQVKAHLWHGLTANQIKDIVTKVDGKTLFSYQGVKDVVDKLVADPKWRGDRQEGSGAPRKTTARQDKELEKKVFQKRGREKVTVPYLQKAFPWAKKLSRSLLQSRLHDVGLAYLRRREKTIVTKKYLAERRAYCRKVLATPQNVLNSWAYTDGTVFFLDRIAHALHVRVRS